MTVEDIQDGVWEKKGSLFFLLLHQSLSTGETNLVESRPDGSNRELLKGKG